MKMILALILVTHGLMAATQPIELGQASLSLKVADISVSKAFYEKLGFEPILGSIGEKFLILKNASNGTVVGIFQGHFEDKFIQTFNPLDVRKVQRQLKAEGISFLAEAPEGTGPASAFLKDPDGNLILLDQHN